MPPLHRWNQWDPGCEPNWRTLTKKRRPTSLRTPALDTYRKAVIEARVKGLVTSLGFRSPPKGQDVRHWSQSRLHLCWLSNEAFRHALLSI